MNIGSLEIDLMTNIARLQRDMDQANRVVGGAMQNISRMADMAKGAIAGITAGLSAGAFAAMVKGAIDSADALNDMSVRTKIAIADLAGLRHAAQLSDISLDDTAKMVNKLSVEMGRNSEKFAKMGVTARDPLQALMQFADKFAAIEDPQARAALGADALGKSWETAAPLLALGGTEIARLIEQGKELNPVTEEMAAKAGEFNDALDTLSGAAMGWKTQIASALLPALNALTSNIGALSGAVSATIAAIGPAMKIAAAYFALFVAAPAIFQWCATAVGRLQVQMALLKMEMASGATINTLFGTSLNGVGIAATWTSGALGKLKIAAATLFAAFAGWEIGTYLSEQFVEVRLMGLALVAGLLKGWEHIKYGFQMAMEGIQFAFETFVNAHKKLFGEFLMMVANGLDAAGFDEKAAKVKTYANSLIGTFDTMKTFEARTAGIRSEHAKAIAAIDDNVQSMFEYELATKKAAAAKKVLAETPIVPPTTPPASRASAGAATPAAGGGDISPALKAAQAYLDIMSQVDEVTRNAANGMADAFGRVGSAIGGLTTAMSGYQRSQAAIAAQLQAAMDKAVNTKERIAAIEDADQQTRQAGVRYYGDMANAAKGFFKEHTAGYKVMEGVEKAYRAQEMALAIENMLAKSGLLTSFTSLFVASKATEEAVDTAATGKSVIRSGIRAAADGVAAFAKTLASVPFPYNIAAGASVVALLAAAGVAVRGGGSAPASSQELQERAGTGTVFGDASAKSDSIAKSIAVIEKNSQLGLSYSGGMLQSLRNIEASMAGFTNLVIRGVDTSGALGQGGPSFSRQFIAPNEAGFLSLNDNGLARLLQAGDPFSTKATAKLLGGIFGGKRSLHDSGVLAEAVKFGNLGALNAMSYQEIKKDGGLFRSDKYSTNTSSLGAEANAQIAQIIRDMGGAVTAAAGMLGLGGDAFTAKLNSFVVDIGKISLKDLSGEEIQKQFAAIFSKLGDDMARFAVGGLTEFQKVGEGYLETLSRIASDYAAVDGILRTVNGTFGATGIASVKARERLIDLVGGIDKLAEQTNSFAQNYLTEAERLAPMQQYVTEQMTAMGYASVKTKDQFKALVLGMVQSGALATKEGAENYAKLMQIEDLFAQAYDGQQELLNKQRDAVTAAYEREADAMRQAIDRHTAFADSIRGLIDSTKLGSMSPLTPEQKYAEAKAQYQAIAAAAMTGDVAAQARYREAHDAFLSISQTLNASDGRYIADYMVAQANNEQLLAYSAMQITVEQAALDAARAQVSGILAVEQAVLSLPEALAQYFAAGGTQPGAQLPPVPAPAPAPSSGQQNQQSNAALLAELQELRKEVAGLRADQQQQTGDLIQGQYDAADRNAEQVGGVLIKARRESKVEEALA